jgi:hypothetical protein
LAKRKVYKTTTVARAKAAPSKARSARSGKKKASPRLNSAQHRYSPSVVRLAALLPAKKRELSTSQPRTKPHRDRRLIAAERAEDPNSSWHPLFVRRRTELVGAAGYDWLPFAHEQVAWGVVGRTAPIAILPNSLEAHPRAVQKPCPVPKGCRTEKGPLAPYAALRNREP